MIITYEGVDFIKLQQGDLTVALNPVSKQSKLSGSNFGADVAMISLNHPDMNGVDAVTRKEKAPFVINGPGEYEVAGFFIKGYQSQSVYGGTERINTIYAFEIDGIRIVYLGALSQKDLDPQVKEELGDIDILFVPIGGEGVLDAAEAYNLAVKREPHVIIPIHFNQVGEKDALKKFIKEGGEEDLKPVEKLTIKKKDIETMKGDIVVLEAIHS